MKLLRIPNRSVRIALFGLISIVLSACGSSSTSPAAPAAPTTTSLTVTPYMGKFSGGTVVIKDKSGATAATGTIGANGLVTVTIPASTPFPLLTEVTGTYTNINTGTSETNTVPIRSIVPNVGVAAKGVAVSAITELAVSKVEANGGLTGNISEAVASDTITAAATVLNMTYEEATNPPVFNATGKSDDPATLKLAALAVALNGKAGTTLVDKVKTTSTNLNAGTLMSTEIPQITIDAAIIAVNGGASSQLATPATPVAIAVTVPTVTLDAAIITASAQSTQNNLVANRYVAAATSASGLHEIGIFSNMVAPFVMDFVRKWTAGTTVGSYNQTATMLHELMAGNSWSISPMSQVRPYYYVTQNTPGWNLWTGSMQWQLNADGSFTEFHPRVGAMRFNVVETNLSGTNIISQIDLVTVLGVYPAGAFSYNATTSGTQENYRLNDDAFNYTTNVSGITLTNLPNLGVDTFCTQNMVVAPLPAPTATANYQVFFAASCAAADINAALASPPIGSTLLTTRTIGSTGAVQIVHSSANGAWANGILGVVNGRLLSGSYNPIGSLFHAIFNEKNQTAANAELNAHYPLAPPL